MPSMAQPGGQDPLRRQAHGQPGFAYGAFGLQGESAVASLYRRMPYDTFKSRNCKTKNAKR